MKVIKRIICFLGKLFGLIPFLILLRPRYYTENPKKHTKAIKGGAIITSNHYHLMDFFTIWFAHPWRHQRFFISEAVYQHSFVGFLCKIVDSILVHRERSDMTWMDEAEKTVNKGSIVTIFPEGKIVRNGRIEQFHPAAVYLALRTGKPIIPHYIEPNYFKWKRARIIMGDPIYVKDYIKSDNPTPDEVREMCEILRKKTMELKRKMELYRKYHTRSIIWWHSWFNDFSKAILWLPTKFVFPAKFHYLNGATKKDRKPVGKALVMSKHYWFSDGPILSVHMMSRRIRIVIGKDLYDCRPWLLGHLLCIPYDRKNDTSDPKCFLECINILKAEGCIGIYPEGHIQENTAEGEFHQGAAYFSLMTGSPVLFYLMAKPWKPFHFNHVMIGKTIDPKDLYTPEEMKKKETIAAFNEILRTQFFDLQKEANKYVKKPIKKSKK